MFIGALQKKAGKNIEYIKPKERFDIFRPSANAKEHQIFIVRSQISH